MPDNLIPLPTEAQRWREREQERFRRREYKCLPWAGEPWYVGTDAFARHYAHVSTADPSKLAYTPSEQHGVQDRQIRMKPGKYLRKYFPDMAAQDIERWAGKFAAENEILTLRLARTEDEIEQVYLNGPHSCMSHEAGSYESPVHPTRAFGAGDLAVGYVQRGDTISARTICWPDKRVFCGTIYGDKERMDAALMGAGYSVGSLAGARLLKIECGGRHVETFAMPWLDGDCTSVDVRGDFFIVAHHGAHNARNTNGTSGGYPCDRCEDSCGEETFSIGDDTWCESCYESHAFPCARCEETYPEDEYNNVEDESWCNGCARDDAYTCEKCDSIYRQDSVSNPLCEIDSTDLWCQDCANEYATFCDPCGTYRTGAAEEVCGAVWCEDCLTNGAYPCEQCDEWYEAHVRPTANRFQLRALCEDCYTDSLIDDGEETEPVPSALLPAHCASILRSVRRAA